MRAVRTILIASIACLGACTNPDGALRLALTPDKRTFLSDEPIRLTANLSADKGRICIDKPTTFAFELQLRRVGMEQAFQKDHGLFLCGTSLFTFPRILFEPVIALGHALDVADTANRYVVVSPESPCSITFDVFSSSGDDRILAVDVCDSLRSMFENEGTRFEPGRYQMTAKFQSEPTSFYHPPLFWRVYDGSAVGEAQFEIVANRKGPEYRVD